MSDRYLYKAKRIDNGEWVEGYYFCMTHTDGRHTHHFIIPLGADLSLGMPIEKIQVEIDSSTICQYTGLHDCTKWEQLSKMEQDKFLSEWNIKENRKNQKEDWNGKKIWENDIVKNDTKEPIVGIIEYDVENTAFLIHWVNVVKYSATYYPWKENEVVGNIFDNPELLEGDMV